jgi:hypothetical protein
MARQSYKLTLWRSPEPEGSPSANRPCLKLCIDLSRPRITPKTLDADPVQLGHKLAMQCLQAALHKAVVAPPKVPSFPRKRESKVPLADN